MHTAPKNSTTVCMFRLHNLSPEQTRNIVVAEEEKKKLGGAAHHERALVTSGLQTAAGANQRPIGRPVAGILHSTCQLITCELQDGHGQTQ